MKDFTSLASLFKIEGLPKETQEALISSLSNIFVDTLINTLKEKGFLDEEFLKTLVEEFEKQPAEMKRGEKLTFLINGLLENVKEDKDKLMNDVIEDTVNLCIDIYATSFLVEKGDELSKREIDIINEQCKQEDKTNLLLTLSKYVK
jgi:hypothetical protein